MTNTRPQKRQKTSHTYQKVMLMTTLSIMNQIQQDEPRPAKRRRTNEYVSYTHTYEEMMVADALLCMCRK
jgi:hypothetical protein